MPTYFILRTGQQGRSIHGSQPYPLGQAAYPQNSPAPYHWPQMGSFDPCVQPNWQPTESFDPSFQMNTQVQQTPVKVKTKGGFKIDNRGVQGKTQSGSRGDRQQFKSDWLWRRICKVFTIYGHGGYLGNVTWSIYISFKAIMTPASSCHTFGFRSITYEGMHQFHSNFTEGYGIRK